jgi:hypothetical protein
MVTQFRNKIILEKESQSLRLLKLNHCLNEETLGYFDFRVIN